MGLFSRFVVAAGVAALLLGGCGGQEAPPATPSPTAAEATATPEVSGTPEATPDATPEATPEATSTPRAGAATPSSAEVEAYQAKQKAKDLVLARSYEEAIPVLEGLVEKNPKDHELHFYLMLAHGNLDYEPSPESKAYTYAQKVVDLAPTTNEGVKAKDYIISANSEPKQPKQSVPGTTLDKMTAWTLDRDALYKLPADTTIYTGAKAGLTKDGQKQIWQMEVYPEAIAATETLPKGTEIMVLGENEFLYSKNAWRGPLPRSEADYNSNMYKISAFYVEVVSGDKKDTTGWLVNQMDRWVAQSPDSEQPWGVWVDNRLNLPRE